MRKFKKSKRQVGETLVETACATFVVTVGLCGLVSATTVAMKTEQFSRNLDNATSTAMEQVEDVRAASADSWSGLKTDFDGSYVPIDGGASTAGDRIATTVTSDTSAVCDATGMWESGATAPNFWFVKVGGVNPGHAFATAVQFQTYVANRTGISAGTAGSSSSSSSSSSPPPDTGTMASRFSPTITSFTTVQGPPGSTSTFNITNGGSSAVTVSAASMTLPTGGLASEFKVGTTTVFKDTKKTTRTPKKTWTNGTGPSIAAGAALISVTYKSATLSAGAPATLSLTFTDGSTATFTVRP